MDFVFCPFNSEHKVRGTELRIHITTCPNKPVEKPAALPLPKTKTNWKTLLPNPPRNVEVETRFYDPQDPERLLQCPYDSNHQIRACRFPYHLIKCRKNHNDVAMHLATCPFNARHLVPRAELSHHISSCDDKSCIEQDIAGEKNYYQRDVSPCRWQTPPCDEDWDKDLQNDKATFMWGIPSYPVPSSGTNILMDPKNSLGSSLRAPKSLPYILPWKMPRVVCKTNGPTISAINRSS
ncbi:gametocyte specific factor 1 isoform X2 [Xenopus tropicalis]|uniref:Gametocyte specific factor 1 isoform X2 n=1 Tax=Xenopus tropicalis TaxID=8364 RepID=A0A8J0T0L2_XENTR|nr:gametocyte specific factor 1 isoform X2 [Xenopus tropicalis]|eukprot:XP_017946517.1 PREDICTED: gametocyte specific factor 1 isoform X2 [Xenopus tropicalis]